MPYIKQLKTLSEKLTQTEHDLSMFFNLSLDLLLVTNKLGEFVRVSPSCLNILGYTQDELVGTTWIRLLHPDDFDATMAQFEKMKNGGSVSNFTNRFIRKDGSTCYLSWRASRLVDEEYGYAIGRDFEPSDFCNAKDCKKGVAQCQKNI